MDNIAQEIMKHSRELQDEWDAKDFNYRMGMSSEWEVIINHVVERNIMRKNHE